MSLLKANSVQIGQSNTATNNFTLTAAAQDGTIKLARGNSGATTSDILTINSSGAISGATINGGSITLGTAVNAATGSPTSIDFTGIPSWAKKITVIFYRVSSNSTSLPLLRLGTNSGIISTGYESYAGYGGSAGQFATDTTGFVLSSSGAWVAATSYSGAVTILNISGNNWVSSLAANSSTQVCGGGSIALSATLDRLRITTVNGTDTFDAGSINIMYEG